MKSRFEVDGHALPPLEKNESVIIYSQAQIWARYL